MDSSRLPALTRFSLLVLVLLGLAAVSSPVVLAQIDLGGAPVGRATDYTTWTVLTPEAAVAPGGTATIGIVVEIEDNWKLYAMDSPLPTRAVSIDWSDLPPGVVVERARQSEPVQAYDQFFDKEVRYFEGRATLETDLRLADTLAAGTYPLGGTVEFMICDDRICLPPTRTPVESSLTVSLDGASRVQPEIEQETTVASGPFAGDAGGSAEGLPGFLLLAIGAGLAALLTPCVFPMIPLTVSFFAKQSDTRGGAVRMASVYGFAIVATFTGLGVIMALVSGASGAQSIAANPWVNLFIGGVFVVFALSLLGLFELRLPSGLVNYVNRQGSEKQGYLGVIFMGLTLTLVSFSCTVPFVGALLASTVGGAWLRPVLGMVAFSATFALPFVVFALFPNRLAALPTSGSWMQAVKVTLGFVELAAALKFLSNADLVWGLSLLSRPLAIALTVVIFFLAGLYLIGRLRLVHTPAQESIGVGRLLTAVVFFGTSLYMIPGLFGASLGTLDAYLPPRSSTDYYVLGGAASASGVAFDDEGWYTDDLEGAFEEARATGQLVFIDFTGYTCTNCRAMESNVFPQPAVAQAMARHVRLRLYTDGPQDEVFQKYQLDLVGTTALPTYALVNPTGETLVAAVSGMQDADEFARFLQRGPDPAIADAD